MAKETESARGGDHGALTGRTLGDFLVMEKLGEGGVGAAYRAQQTLLGREAVVKVLLAGADADGQTQSRFLREARLASRLEHPYAVSVYSFGAEPDGLLWIAMELVRGKTLGAWLKEHGPMPLARFAPFFDALCDVVDAVHEKGIIHRDIKPSNVMVMVRNGRLLPKLLDLGIATVVQREQHQSNSADDAVLLTMLEKTPQNLGLTSSMVGDRPPGAAKAGGYVSSPTPAISSSTQNTPTTLNRIELAEKLSITREAEAVGSPAYMAPEQWLNSRDVTAQADIYSLGILAWQTLTGRLPFIEASTTKMALAHLRAPIPKLPDGFPEGLQAVFATALGKTPKDRPLKASELGRAVLRVATASEKLLPSLPNALRQSWVDAAPQPLAESIALLESVRNGQAGFEASRRVLRLMPRFLALLGVLCRQRIGPSNFENEEPLRALISVLRNGRLEHDGWVSLLWASTSPWAAKRELYPLPGLLDFCCDASGAKTTAFRALEEIELDEVPATEEVALVRFEELVAHLSVVLRAAEFLLQHTLVRATAEPGVFENFGGCRRPVRATLEVRMPSAVEGDLLLIDETLTPALRLNPIVQGLAPSPGEAPDIFLFSGAGRYGARLVSAPREFERQDEATWEWLDAEWPRASHDSDLTAAEEKPPYRGLASFTAADAQDFFGREPEAQAVANRLRVSPFLAVVGPSGVGKSSFVQAGVAPLLAEDLVLVVVRPGNTPLVTLLNRLKALGVDITGLQAAIEKDPSALSKRLNDFAAATKSRYLLVIDQFEELITLCPSVAERETYAGALVSAARNPEDPFRVVLTLRDDFLIRAQALDALKDHLSTGLHLLGTPGENELLRILTQPLKRVGFAFEDNDLPRQMVKEVSQQSGALALLSFSATKLWAARDTHFRRLTRQAYQAMGGVGGALAGHAEEVMATMTEEERRVTREAFRHLVSSSGTRAVLTRADANELLGNSAAGARVLEKLIDARLLVTSEAGGGDDRVEIIHEALLSSWPRLVQWQRENAELARVRDALRAASRQWQDQRRPRGMLWRDETLTEYQLWRPKYPGALTSVEQAFAEASVREFERGRRIRRGLLIAAFAVLSVGIVILVQANGRAEANAVEARKNAAESAQRLTLMTAEQGRQAFLAGRPAEALALLSTARDAGLDNAGVQYMVRKSTAAVGSLQRSVELGAGVSVIALSPNKTEIAVSTSDDSVSFLNAQTFAVIRTVKVAKGTRNMRLMPDGKTMITCSATGILSAWDIETGGQLDQLRIDPLPLVVCMPSPDGKTIVTGGVTPDSHRIGFDGHHFTPRSGQAYDTSTIRGVRWSPDGSRFVVVMAEASGPPPPTKRHPIEVLDGNPLWLVGIHGPVRAAVWSPDGKAVYTGDEGGVISKWDSATGHKLRELSGHRGAVIALGLTRDFHRLFSLGVDGSLRIWDAESGAQIGSVPAHERGRELVVSEVGDIVVTFGADGSTKMWSLSGQLRRSVPAAAGGISAMTVNAANDRILTGSIDGTLRAFQLSGVDFRLAISLPGDTAGVSFDRDEKQFVAASFNGPFARYPLQEAPEAERLKTSLLDDRAFALSGDGRFIADDHDGTIRVVSLAGQVEHEFPGHADGEATVAFNATDTHLLATGDFNMPLLYEIATGQQRLFPEKIGTAAAVFAVNTPSDVWVGTDQGEVIFWPENGPLRRNKVAKTVVVAIRQSPDAMWVAVTTYDQRVHLLRADTLEEVAVAPVGAAVNALGFSADSTLIVLGDRTGNIQVWTVAPLQQVDARKIGSRLFQLSTFTKSASFLTLTPSGLLVWDL